MYTLCIKCRDGDRIISFTLKDEARQELMRFWDDGHISQYQYQQYLGFLLNGYESVQIDGDTVFECAVPALVNAEEDE
jgi:hypothetical protein